MNTFYLGTHHPDWLARVDVPLFVSRRAIEHAWRPRRDGWRVPNARTWWALDSGGFSELSIHGTWTLTAREYFNVASRCFDYIGGLAWAAPQDWMCEPDILRKTGLSISEHQRRTIDNLLELRSYGVFPRFIPVLQGWTWGDYLDHAEAYDRAGIDLAAEPIVGIGSICRRQNTMRAAHVVADLSRAGLRLHGFGFKRTGLVAAAQHLVSADSMAWSFNARRNPPLPGCKHKSCANCVEYALAWREETLELVERAGRRAA